MTPFNISFAGAGRVGSALCKEMYRAGFKIDLIVSVSPENGKSLADSCNSRWSSDLIYPEHTDIIIVAVPDQKFNEVLQNIDCKPETLVLHTAGSIGIDDFPEHINRKGVFYPLQTFSKDRKINFKDLPFLIEGSDEHSLAIIKQLAETIGGKVIFSSGEQRRMIHLAAVFICNFTNHMLTQGQDIASEAGFAFDLLGPLLKETIAKALDIGPARAQTGPAVRNDQITIEKHLELLSSSPGMQRLYNEITRSIIQYHNKS
jgi:predicted short-subunit dehydrogenase-like oxidoreductase (DUF2520 family)